MEKKKFNIFRQWWFWTILAIIIVASIICLVVVIVFDSKSDDSSDNNNDLIGIWYMPSDSKIIWIEFEEGNDCKKGDSSSSKECTYKIKKDKVIIKFDNNGDSETYKYFVGSDYITLDGDKYYEDKEKAERILDRNKDKEDSSNKEQESEKSTVDNSSTNPKQKLLSDILDLIKEGQAFDSGDYVKGDIPAGEYAFITLDGSTSYYCEKDASDSIIDNENFDSFGYVKVHAAGNLETDGVLINIDALSKLGVSGAKEIYEILNDKSDWNEAGFYKVGLDIEPGKYIVESYGSGYYAILSGPVGINKIVNNDNYNGKATITLKSGQYLELSRSKITKAQ